MALLRAFTYLAFPIGIFILSSKFFCYGPQCSYNVFYQIIENVFRQPSFFPVDEQSRPPVPYSDYILAPKSRTLFPISVYNVNGSVTGAKNLLESGKGSAVLHGESAITFDYGKNIAGMVSVTFGDFEGSLESIALSFSESNMWISSEHSDATANDAIDQIIWLNATGPGTYTVPEKFDRGGFRYLSLIHSSPGDLEITKVVTHFSAMPHWPNDALGQYTGYFYCNDELLNRIWYAGAYTNQLCTINPKHGNAIPYDVPDITNGVGVFPVLGWWYNNFTITKGLSAIVDGAKRDRLVWAGDMSVAVPAIFVSTNDLISVRNALDSLFIEQNTLNGQLPYAGAPMDPHTRSYTYHLYALIGVAEYFHYSNDFAYLKKLWHQWKNGMQFALDRIDETGLMFVDASDDWLRLNMWGRSIEANAILYYTIHRGLGLASVLNDTTVFDDWGAAAENLKATANHLLWNETAGLFNDNDDDKWICPQDGNVWALVANLTNSREQAQRISDSLVDRWTPYGAPAPELPGSISPFVSSIELRAHMTLDHANKTLELIRRMWGYMLNHPGGTNSTFVEGYEVTGNLHYPTYHIDQRLSHAHGWSTGPTSVLSFLIAGIQLVTAGGQEWRIAPSLGDLTVIEAGYTSGLGSFTVNIKRSDRSYYMHFETPRGTSGSVSIQLPSCSGQLTLIDLGRKKKANPIILQGNGKDRYEVAQNLNGGEWVVDFNCI